MTRPIACWIAAWLLVLLLPGCDPGPPAPAPTRGRSDAEHPVRIHPRGATPRVATGLSDHRGRPVGLACGTCHTGKTPQRLTDAAALDEFHQGLTFAHGTLSCLACHDRRDYDRLALADGQPVAFKDVVTLCAQCHGPQYRDYRNGSHGGMTGYWDLRRGPRLRNQCLDCHDPHAPRHPQVMPAPGPNDRFHGPRPAH